MRSEEASREVAAGGNFQTPSEKRSRAIIIPRWRGEANYLFETDADGSIVRVVYPDGDRFLRRGPHD